MHENKPMTGYPSIDKPWLKHYSEEAINVPLPKMTMYQYVWENNKDHLTDIALRYYGTKITYGKLFEEIKKAANAFYALGVRAGDIVTIISMHTPETIYAVYGLNYIGAVANMVYLTLAEKEILHTIENTNSKLLLLLDAALEKVEAIKTKLRVPVVVLEAVDSMPLYLKQGYRIKAKPKKHTFMTWQGFLKQSEVNPLLATDHAAPAVIVYTSGTTGEPKGVLLCNEGLNIVVSQLKAAYQDHIRQETTLMILPPFIAFGISMIHRALGTGMDITLWIEMESDRIGKAFARLKPNRFVSGPLLIEGIMKHARGDLSSVYDITGGGEAISSEMEDKFNQFIKDHNSKARYMTGYGMSEFGSVITLNWLNAYKKGSVGIPLQLTDIKIIDKDDSHELRYKEIGELLVSTPCAMLSYYKNPNATKEIIEVEQSGKRWFHTGDLGYVDEEGFVFLAGRIKRIYTALDSNNVACKIFPQRIEECLSKADIVDKCAAIVQPDETRRFIPIAFIQLKESGTNQVLQELYQTSKKQLPEHMQPRRIYILEKIPMTASGKIDYRALEEIAKQN